MNLDKAKRYILLKQSGELSPRRQRQLEAFLVTSSAGRTFEQELLQLTQYARVPDVPPIPTFHLHQILDEARVLSRANRTAPDIALHWRPALAYSAVALLVVAGWLTFSKAPSTQIATNPAAPGMALALDWDDGIDKQLDALGEQFVLAEEGLAEYTESGVTLDEMAAELLKLEGSQI